MLQLGNSTGLQGTLYACPDPDGIESLFTVVKGTFRLEDGLVPAPKQAPVRMKDEHHGDPLESSIRLPSDISLMKPGTDVLLLGHCHAPRGKATHADVSLSAGSAHKVVRVFGDRVWVRDAVGFAPSAPEPFEVMPLVWERAFGGADDASAGPATDSRNPVGIGFRADDGRKGVEGRPLPNLEDPSEPMSSWKQTPTPACFAPVSAHWEPRRSFAGTYDDSWQKARAPFLPTDFDPRFFQLAPAGLVVEGHLQPGEWIEVRGASSSGQLGFFLPLVRIEATYVLDGVRRVRPAVLDTVVIEPEASIVTLVWRAVLPCDKKLLRVSLVEAALVPAA
jgi:hypothetical protein